MNMFITCRIDYCNALISGLPKKNTAQLLLIQNSTAMYVDKDQKESTHHINFKVSTLALYKALNGLSLTHLSDLVLSYKPSRTLRSPSSGLLIIPKVRTKKTSFYYYGPHLRNSLPEDLRTAESVYFYLRASFLIWFLIEPYLSLFYSLFSACFITWSILLHVFLFITYVLCPVLLNHISS